MEQTKLNYYLVAMVDVLGQQAELAKLTRMPETQEERTEAARILGLTHGRVTSVRRFFESFFAAAKRDHPILDTLDNETADAVRNVTKSDVKFSHFSDTTAVNVSLASDDSDLCEAASGVLDALAAAAYAQMLTLANGFAIRGGIEIGLGSPIGGHEVYGPVLSRAHWLESRVAGYPRIVAGPELVKYLRGLVELEPSNDRDEAAVEHGRRSAGLLTADEDGAWIIDFASQQSREVFELSADRTKTDAAEIFSRACEFVEAEYFRTRDAGDLKLAARYLWLRRYLDRGSEHWTKDSTLGANGAE